MKKLKKLSKEEVELGTVTALMRRAAKRRIPRLLRIKKAVEGGARLTNFQITFLSKVFADAQDSLPYVDSHPELHDMAAKMLSIYHEITEQALKNEEALLQQKAPRIELPPK
jgi:hypothetical protein